MSKISWEEVNTHSESFRDNEAKIFFWKGELYRGIARHYMPIARKIFEEGILADIVTKGLFIDTEWTDLQLKNYGAVIKPRQLPFVSYPFEWCGQMLKDAALLVVDLEIELAQHGLTLNDPHPWNVLFAGCYPVYIDFGSIMPASEVDRGWHAYERYFEVYYLRPLRLYIGGHGKIARAFLHDYDHYLTEREVNALVGKPSFDRRVKIAIGRLLRATRSVLQRWQGKNNNDSGSDDAHRMRLVLANRPSRLRALKRARRELQRMVIPVPKYVQEGNVTDAPITVTHAWTRKQHLVHQLLRELRPRSVMDAGDSGGWYAKLAAQMGIDSVAIERDEAGTTKCYLDARRSNLSVQTLIMDIRYPTAGHGVCYEEYPSAITRLRSDMVIAMDLSYKFSGDNYFDSEVISRALAIFSKRWLLIELLPEERQEYSQCYSNNGCGIYALCSPGSALDRQFSFIRILHTDAEGKRILLCERSAAEPSDKEAKPRSKDAST